MDVNFLHMWVDNFKSFIGEHQLYLGPKEGLWFVRGRNRDERRLGSNGAGKSTLWDALCWCLYGQCGHEGRLRNPDVRPWRGSKGPTVVAVLVQVGKRRVVIERRTGGHNSLTIGRKAADNAAVVKLLGMTYEIMTSTILLGQGGKLFFDLTPGQKMDLLSEVMSLDKWDGRSFQVSTQVNKLEAEEATVEGEITGLKAGIDQIYAGVKDVEKQAEEWRVENAKAQERAAKIIKKHQRKIDAMENVIAAADLKYDGAMTEVKGCERQITQLGLDVSNAKTNLFTKRAARERAVERIGKLNDYLDELKQTKRCPTCGNVVRPGDLKQHQQEVLAERKALMDNLPKLKTKALATALKTAEDLLEHEKKYLAGFHAKADSALRELKKAQGDVAVLKEELRTAKQAQQENPHTSLLRQAKVRLRELEVDLRGAEKDRRAIERELVRARGWVKGFKDIKLHIIEDLLAELELTTAGMLEEVGLVGWEVRYQIERELKSGKSKRALTILIGSPRSKGLVKWESWSGGEGQRLRVVGALSLATVLLNQAGVEPNIEILDEPTQHMSSEGIGDLCDFLADRAKSTGRRIFYCDQQSVESNRFAGVITVRKGTKGSRIGIQRG